MGGESNMASLVFVTDPAALALLFTETGGAVFQPNPNRVLYLISYLTMRSRSRSASHDIWMLVVVLRIPYGWSGSGGWSLSTSWPNLRGLLLEKVGRKQESRVRERERERERERLRKS